jgi:uncharacterized protein
MRETSLWRETLAAFILEQAKPVEKYGHQPRLYALACEIGQSLVYDDDIVFAAAWLHDLGVFTGHRPEDPELLSRWDNTAYAIEQAPAILRGLDFPEVKITRVLECIRTHQPYADPQTLEAILLRDADILEQLGAIAALRTVCKIGRDTRFHTFTDAVASLQRALDTLPGLLRLQAAIALAEPRIETLRDFLRALRIEVGRHLH